MKISVKVTFTTADQDPRFGCETRCGSIEEVIEEDLDLKNIAKNNVKIEHKPIKIYTPTPLAGINVG